MLGTATGLTGFHSGDAVRKHCEALPRITDQLSCTAGYAHGMGLYGKFTAIENFCQSLPRLDMKRNCYNGLFFSLNASHSNKPLATACDLVKDDECMRTLIAFQKGIYFTPMAFSFQ